MIQSLQECEDYILASLVKDWLRPSDASINLVNASKLRYSDTGRWFLESDRYKWLKTTSGARLWLHGIPGCGKTVLSSTIIEDLRVRSSATKTAVIYFFFSSSEESKQKLDHVLRSLIFQLVGWAESINVHLLKLFKSSPKRIEQPQTTQLVEVFNQMVSELGDVIVVLDALDESEERHDLLRWITSPSNQKFRFILTSRWEIDIEKALAPWLSPNRTINLESDLVGDDIEAYVHYRLKEEERLSRWTLMHEEIMGTLVDKAAGMFRWVYCQLQALSECLDKPAVRRMLQTLPNDLNETYDRILQKIPMPRVPNAIKLLQLLVFSKRSLRLEEVIDAVATEPDTDPPFDAEDRITPPDAIMGYCSHLVRITIVQRDEFAYSEGEYKTVYRQEKMVQLAHSSVREYLLLNRVENPYHHRFEEKTANSKISQICLAYLWTASEASRTSSKADKFPLAVFAAEYWPKHARIAGESEDVTFNWTSKILTTEHFKQYWLRCKENMRGLLERETFRGVEPAPALYYATLGGLDRSVRHLLRDGVDPDARGGWYGNALHAASVSGDIRIVRILLDQGARVNAEGRIFGSALQAAAHCNHLDVIRLLLKYGADVEGSRSSRLTRTPLQTAAHGGHVGVVETLIEHGADINAAADDPRHGTPLQEAADQGHLDVVRVLIDRGADTDVRHKIHGTALKRAVKCDRMAVARALLHAGAGSNAEDGVLDSALEAACGFKHVRRNPDLRLIRFLLDKGADPNAQNERHDSLLYMACSRKQLVVATMLLEYGADPDARYEWRDTLLYIACYREELAVATMLLTHGADPNIEGGKLGTALAAASYKGSMKLVQTLLDHGADVNSKGGWYGNALQSSCYSRSYALDPGLIQLLLDKGARINAQGGDYGTALCAASSKGQLEIVELLLREGADVNAPGGKFDYALCAAAHKGHIDVVRALLENGAVAGTPTNPYDFALQVAIEQGNKDIAKLLFEEGALEELTIDRANSHPGLKVRSLKNDTRCVRLTMAALSIYFEHVVVSRRIIKRFERCNHSGLGDQEAFVRSSGRRCLSSILGLK